MKFITRTFGVIFGTYATTALSWAKWAIIAGLITTVGTFGFKAYGHYSDMKKSIATQAEAIEKQKGDIRLLKSEKERISKELEDIKKSNQVTEEITSEKADLVKKSADTLNKVKEDRVEQEKTLIEKKIVIVKKPAPKGSKQKTVKEEKKVEVADIPDELSKIRINSIWKSYCSSNAPRLEDVDQCKELLKTD